MAMAGEAQRDRDLLLNIKRYCDDALDAAQQVGSEAEFLKNRLYQHAIAMCVLEIVRGISPRKRGDSVAGNLPDARHVRASLSQNGSPTVMDDGQDGFADTQIILRSAT